MGIVIAPQSVKWGFGGHVPKAEAFIRRLAAESLSYVGCGAAVFRLDMVHRAGAETVDSVLIRPRC